MKKKINILIVSAVIVATAITLTVACSKDSVNDATIVSASQKIQTDSAEMALVKDILNKIWRKSDSAFCVNRTRFMALCDSGDVAYFYQKIDIPQTLVDQMDSLIVVEIMNRGFDEPDSIGCLPCLYGTLSDYGKKIDEYHNLRADILDMGGGQITPALKNVDSCLFACTHSYIHPFLNDQRLCYLNCMIEWELRTARDLYQSLNNLEAK